MTNTTPKKRNIFSKLWNKFLGYLTYFLLVLFVVAVVAGVIWLDRVRFVYSCKG